MHGQASEGTSLILGGMGHCVRTSKYKQVQFCILCGESACLGSMYVFPGQPYVTRKLCFWHFVIPSVQCT